MSKTPKCPYCGAEMDLYLNVDSNDKWNARYNCAECYSFGPPIIDCEEKSYAEEVALAYTLHRAEPENRPFTLKEVRKKLVSDTINPPYVWVEEKRESRWVSLLSVIARLGNEAVFGRYNQSWRCWPRKPTPEQMAAEKWEE